MTKSQLIRALFERQDFSLREAEIIVNTVFEMMSDSLIRGERIEIRHFGSFRVKNYGSYVGRNPKTGEQIEVKAKRLPFFKVGRGLKDRMNTK